MLSDKNINISIIAPQKEMSEHLCSRISSEYNSVSVFKTAGSFINSLIEKVPDMIVLDMNLPDISGNDLLLVLRNNSRTSRIIIVSISRNINLGEKVKGFELGADEYFSYPLDENVFFARIGNLLKRKFLNKENCFGGKIEIYGLEICLDSRTVVYMSREIRLTSLEFDMLLYFIKNRNRIISRSSLIANVWNKDFNSGVRSVDKKIEILRSKVGGFSSHIETVFGMGYMFK